MFETQTSFTDSLFYDVSAWSFQHAFNVNYTIENNTNMMGAVIDKIERPMGTVDQKGTFAYLFEAHNYYTPKALHLLQEKNIRIKVGLQPFIIEGREYDYGTYMIPVQNQKMDADELFDFLKIVAKETTVDFQGYATGATQGIDLGSREFALVNKPKLAMLVGDDVRSYDAGEIWHLFDTRYEIPLTRIDVDQIGDVDLNEYTHFILPSYSGDKLEIYSKELKRFAKNGGVIIGYRSSVEWLEEHDFIKLDFLSKDEEEDDYEDFNGEVKGVSFVQKENYFGAKLVSGAIFDTKIDRSHPINFGVHSTHLPMFRNTSLFIAPDQHSYDNPIQYTKNPLLNGYISKDRLKQLQSSVPFQVKSLGDGKVIVLTDNTNFRAFWYGTNRILTNAIYLADKM